MRAIYIDSKFRCHVSDDGTMTAVETAFFDGKCDSFIEGYRFAPSGDGHIITPWKPFSELDSAQREYEKSLIADMQTALNTLGVEV